MDAETRFALKGILQASDQIVKSYYDTLPDSSSMSTIQQVIISFMNDITVDFAGFFEEQRMDIGMTHKVGATIRMLSKVGVKMRFNGDAPRELDEIKKLLRGAWLNFRKLNVPGDFAHMMDSDNGKEYAEFFFVDALTDIVLCPELPFSPEKLELPTPASLDIRSQTWLAGLGDALSEVGKAHIRRLRKRGLTKEQRIAMYERHIEVLEAIYECLGRYETIYPFVIDNSRRQGFQNTYRGMLLWIDKIILRESEALAAILDRESEALAAILNRIAE